MTELQSESAQRSSHDTVAIDSPQSGDNGSSHELTLVEDLEAVCEASLATEASALDQQSRELEEQLRTAENQVAQLTQELEFFKDKAVQLDNRVFQMRTLLQSGKGFSEIMDLEPLLHAFMAVCRERYAAKCSAVLLLDDLDPDNIFYRVRAYHGLPDVYRDTHGEQEEMLLFRLPYNQGMLWQMIQQGDVFSVRNMQRRPRFNTAFERWNLDVLNSDVWVPLLRGGRVLGILMLGERIDDTQIPEHDYQFLEEIAAVAATTIDSTLKYEKNARILSNLRTLYDVNQQLANVNDFKQLTIETLSSAVNALNAQKANLMLYNPETERLEIKVVWGNIPKQTRDDINSGRLKTKPFAIGEGVSGMAAKTHRPVRMNDRTKISQVGRNIVHCILAVPMMHGNTVVGVITLTNKVKKSENGEPDLDTLGRFGADDEQLLLGLADQAAVNLHKARLYSASITDRLTGLYNKRHFDIRLDQLLELARKNREQLALAETDIDHFKRFNDTYGHKAGDYVLTETARLLSETMREGTTDACFRTGGEEFCILLPQTEAARAKEIVETYRRRVEETEFVYDGQVLKVTVSAGISVFPGDGTDRESLFISADRALYASKTRGRNRVSMPEDCAGLPTAPSNSRDTTGGARETAKNPLSPD